MVFQNTLILQYIIQMLVFSLQLAFCDMDIQYS